jgi:hypothetical protein
MNGSSSEHSGGDCITCCFDMALNLTSGLVLCVGLSVGVCLNIRGAPDESGVVSLWKER